MADAKPGGSRHIALHKPELLMFQRRGKETTLAGREIVVSGDGMSVGQQLIDQIAADESAPPVMK